MKKILLSTLLFILATGPLRADLMWYEGFNYPDGCIETNSGGLWICHSPTTPALDAICINHMEQVSATGGNPVSRQDDIHRLLPAQYTNGGPTVVYASFTVIVTNLPNANGAYFAHFTDNTSSDFFGRVFALTGTPGSNATNFSALPQTFRLGIAATAGAVNKVFPVDLALNTTYQVVLSYDATLAGLDAQLWVNPLGAGDTSVISGDTVSATLQGKVIQAFAFRQASSFGNFFCLVTNLDVATTFDDAATNIWSTNAVAPSIVYPPVGFTNFASIPSSLSVVANGQSLANLTYQWLENGTNISNLLGNSNVFSFPDPSTNDGGSYSVVVTTPYGLSATSAPVDVVFLYNTNPPTITLQPTNRSVYPGQNVTFTVASVGAGPITYQWNYNSAPLTDQTDTTLTITDVEATNGTTGTYECDAINQFGTTHSSNAVLSAVSPPVVTIGQLRGMVDNVFYLPTNSPSLYYTVTGTVINKTNMAVGNYQCAITDGTAGISVYCYGGLANPPNLGDVVQVTGPVGTYSSLEEFDIYSTDPSTSVTIISSNNPAPIPTVLPLTFTNSAAYGGISNALHHYESTLVMLTNVFFPAGVGGTNTFASSTYTMLDQAGNSLLLYVYYGISNVVGSPIPPFCYSITGIMSEFQNNTATNRSAGYEFWVTDISDFVTNPPPAMTLSAHTPGALTWPAVPYSYSYSIYGSTNVSGPYSPVKTGLVFPTASGSYTATNTNAATMFYRVTSP